MDNKLAILGGSPAITIDHDTFAQWPIYGEEEVEAVSELIRHHRLSSAHEGGPIVELERAIAERWGVKHAIAPFQGDGRASVRPLRCRRRAW